jgi:hypothetical protein
MNFSAIRLTQQCSKIAQSLTAGLLLTLAFAAPASAQNAAPPKNLTYPQGWTECAKEGGWCNFLGAIRDVAFGAQGQYVYMLALPDNQLCSNGAFWGDDPAPGKSKSCWVSNSKSRLATAGLCTVEGGTCTVPGSGTVWYGGGGQYLPKMISAAAGQSTSVGCNNSNFGGDPAPGKTKYCLLTP